MAWPWPSHGSAMAWPWRSHGFSISWPWLGYGFDAFWQGNVGASGDVSIRMYFYPNHAHNGFIDLALSLGNVGLALLGMLGTGGERTDLWAHAFGLLAGGLLGAGAAARWPRPPGLALQLLCGALFVVLVIAAWGASA